MSIYTVTSPPQVFNFFNWTLDVVTGTATIANRFHESHSRAALRLACPVLHRSSSIRIRTRRSPCCRARILQSPLLELGFELGHKGSVEKLFDSIDFVAFAVEPQKDGLFVVVWSEGGVSVCDGVDDGCVVGGVVDGVVDGELLYVRVACE